MLDLDMLDYQETQFNFEEKIPSDVNLTAAEIKKVPELRLRLKNAVMHFLMQKRKQSKQSSLIQILEGAAEAIKKKKAAKTQLKEEIAQMGLVQRLDTLDVTKGRISNERFQRLKQEGEKFAEQDILGIQKNYNRLADLVNQGLMPIIENGDIDSQVDLDNQYQEHI